MEAYRRNLASYCRLDLALLEGPPAAARNLLFLRKEPTEKAEERLDAAGARRPGPRIRKGSVWIAMRIKKISGLYYSLAVGQYIPACPTTIKGA